MSPWKYILRRVFCFGVAHIFLGFGGSTNILPWTVFPNGWAHKTRVSLLVCSHHCLEKMMECILFFLVLMRLQEWSSTESRFAIHVYMLFPTITWNQWWGVFSFFLVVLILNLFLEVVSKRWALLNKDFFAVLFLGLETRFIINWKFVPVSRCERLKQYSFFVPLISMLQVHVAILFQHHNEICPHPLEYFFIYWLNNLIFLGVFQRWGPLRDPISSWRWPRCCATSRSRLAWAGVKWPGPLRSYARLFGLDGLTGRELRQLVSEHPWLPYDPSLPSIWKSALLSLLQKHPKVRLHRVVNEGICKKSVQNPYHPWDWYIYLHLVVFYGKLVGKYSSPMDPYG